MAILASLGALMFCSKLVMELLPNIHLLGMFTILFTVIFRAKALIPIYICVGLTFLYAGFTPYLSPYIYVWLLLWGAAMLLPRRAPRPLLAVLYPLLCSLHGFLFGTLYAPAQALLFGLDFKGMIAWIIAGLPWDAVHGISNFCCGILICPLISVLRRTTR